MFPTSRLKCPSFSQPYLSTKQNSKGDEPKSDGKFQRSVDLSQSPVVRIGQRNLTKVKKSRRKQPKQRSKRSGYVPNVACDIL